MTYLASCSQGALSDALSDALTEFQHSLLELGDPWQQWLERVGEARRRFAALIGAHIDEIAIVSSASEGAYQVASGLVWTPGDSVVTSDVEFPSIAHVWLAQRQRHASVRYADTVGGFATVEGYDRAIDDSARLVSVPLVSYRHGQRLPLNEITTLARRRGAQVFIDAYQGAGIEPTNVGRLDCDYLVSGASKFLLGIPGVAFLYVRHGTRRDLDPQLTGWFGRVDPFSFNARELDYSRTARRYELGTPPVLAVYGAVAGMTLLSTVDQQALAVHITRLTGRLHRELTDLGEQIGSPASDESRGPQVAVRDDDPMRLASYLTARRIVTSPRGTFVRLAIHYYNNDADIDAVVRALAGYRSRHRR
ncbi:putative aminotransferase YcbU [Asanoa ishikariensis]|nr:aminotransferase class V-fold PLP-dependent enzyme [Asanoa ishikariensis]GIF69457.1 putative aminotransferase YcbU [Asanoa ishikariensis]